MAPAPRGNKFVQARRDYCQRRTGVVLVDSEMTGRGAVYQPDPVCTVDDDDALAQILDN